jgi:ABC-type glycerol-3-phosphate transport system substrate-binding protein
MKLSVAFLVALVAVAGCSGSNSTPSTNNAVTSVVTLTTPTGTPVPNTVVTLSTDIVNNAPVNVEQTQTTNSAGVATFVNIPAQGVYCVSATIPTSGGSTFVGQCAAPFPATFTLN